MGRSATIDIAGLSKTYGTGPSAVTALGAIDLHVAAGEFVAVVGASGCGKSTLMRIIAGFEAPSGGTVEVNDVPVTAPGPDRGVVFQDYGLFPWLSVEENIAYGPKQQRLGRTTVRDRTRLFMEAVGLSRSADRFPGELSGGMQQRVAIARVLANEPSVMLMDEPFGALDALTRSEMQAELSRIQEETGTTVVFITHSIEEAVFLSDRVVVMAGGASHGNAGHIREIVPIDLPGRRDTTSPAFNEFERHIGGLIHLGNERLDAPG
ncbi:ATP-binding cassette domain-containing protein [Nitriliruptor alkaliphilus]|uniref:ATP-binding cassette domain-containing protein n=1 Tax=Nitriliruptor alkaliphilus TaxID=427918 RepID=UPI0006986A80